MSPAWNAKVTVFLKLVWDESTISAKVPKSTSVPDPPLSVRVIVARLVVLEKLALLVFKVDRSAISLAPRAIILPIFTFSVVPESIVFNCPAVTVPLSAVFRVTVYFELSVPPVKPVRSDTNVVLTISPVTVPVVEAVKLFAFVIFEIVPVTVNA